LRALSLGLGLCFAVIALTSCGGGSPPKSFPSLGSQGSPGGSLGPKGTWQPFAGDRFDVGSTAATVTGVAVDPTWLKLQVTASPDIVTETSYQVHCDQLTTLGKKLRGTTPLTRVVAVPRAKSGATNVQCFVTASATKPKTATMTLKLVQGLRTATSRH